MSNLYFLNTASGIALLLKGINRLTQEGYLPAHDSSTHQSESSRKPEIAEPHKLLCLAADFLQVCVHTKPPLEQFDVHLYQPTSSLASWNIQIVSCTDSSNN